MQIIEKTRSRSFLIEYFRHSFIDMSIFANALRRAPRPCESRGRSKPRPYESKTAVGEVQGGATLGRESYVGEQAGETD